MQHISSALSLIGGEKLTNCMQLMKWALSEQATTHLPASWIALNGYWDDKGNAFLIAGCMKCRHRIDFLKRKEGFCLTRMAKHSICQIKKPIANAMDKEYELALQKSSAEQKQEGMTWNIAQKLGEWHKKHIFWRHRNASENEFNNCCGKKGLEKHEVKVDKAGASLKEEPRIGIL